LTVPVYGLRCCQHSQCGFLYRNADFFS